MWNLVNPYNLLQHGKGDVGSKILFKLSKNFCYTRLTGCTTLLYVVDIGGTVGAAAVPIMNVV